MPENIPQISIGMPIYNGADFVKSTIDSILNQTFKDFELIISDNASTDDTEKICREYAENDERITYLRNDENLGAAKNYNIVFDLAKGKYFKWASHDDYYSEDYLEKCFGILEEKPSIILAYTSRIVIDENDEELEKVQNELNLNESKVTDRYSKFLKIFRYHTIYCDPVFGLIRRDVLAKTKLIGNYPTSDMNLLGELALWGAFHEITEYLFFRRRHEKMSTKANPGMRARAVWFDPTNKNKVLMTRWRWLGEFFSSIKRVNINGADKLLCYYQTLKWAAFRWKGFIADMLYAAKYKVLGTN